MRPFHFISGLPRSGSTLLSALLRQNPRFHANMSGPVAGLIKGLLEGMSASNEYSVFITDTQRNRILRGVFENYYGEEFSADVIFDTNRSWCAQLPLLQTLFPDSKVIACVREVPWIIDSLERQICHNPLSPSSIFNYQSSGTVYSRADGIAGATGMLGFAYNALKEAFYGEHARQLLLIQYETLTSNPQRALDAIYAFIGEAAFAHDIAHVNFDAEAFDAKAGTPGLHTVRPVVGVNTRPTILPPDVFHRFEHDAFWRDPKLNPHSVSVV